MVSHYRVPYIDNDPLRLPDHQIPAPTKDGDEKRPIRRAYLDRAAALVGSESEDLVVLLAGELEEVYDETRKWSLAEMAHNMKLLLKLGVLEYHD